MRRKVLAGSVALTLGVVGVSMGASSALAADTKGTFINSPTSATLLLEPGVLANLTLTGAPERTFMDPVKYPSNLASYSGTDDMFEFEDSVANAKGARVTTVAPCGANATDCAPGRLVIEFSEPLTDVVVHLSDLGASSLIEPNKPFSYFSDAYRLVSSEPAGLSTQLSAGNTFLTDASGAVYGTFPGCNVTPGAGCGSLVLPAGTPISKLEFEVVMRNNNGVANDTNENVIVSVSGNALPKPTQTPTPTPEATVTPSPTPEPTTEPTAEPTPTAAPTGEPTSTPSPSPAAGGAVPNPPATPGAAVPAKPIGPSSTGPLASTGAEASAYAIGAAIVLGAGVLLLVITAIRRRRARS